MRYGLIPESLLERTLLSFGLVPTAMNEAYAPLNARAIVLATELGVWDAIGVHRHRVATTATVGVRAPAEWPNGHLVAATARNPSHLGRCGRGATADGERCGARFRRC